MTPSSVTFSLMTIFPISVLLSLVLSATTAAGCRLLRHQLEHEGVGRPLRPRLGSLGVIGCDGDERNGTCEDFLVSERLLMRAAQGDEEAFRELVAPHRRELHFHCYRILGSMQDAEDVLQETLLAAWRGLGRFEERASLRAWLYRIATNRCLNALRDAGRRPPPRLDLPFATPEPTRLGEPTWLEPYPDVLLEGSATLRPDPTRATRPGRHSSWHSSPRSNTLPPRQRAALVLRDVLGFHAAEVAGMLDSSVDSVKGALKRARATLEQRLPATDRDRSPLPNSPGERELVQRFADAFQTDDINGIVALLTEDAWLTMPPSTLEYQGRLAIASFLRENTNWRRGQRYRLVPTRANTQPAFGTTAPMRTRRSPTPPDWSCSPSKANGSPRSRNSSTPASCPRSGSHAQSLSERATRGPVGHSGGVSGAVNAPGPRGSACGSLRSRRSRSGRRGWIAAPCCGRRSCRTWIGDASADVSQKSAAKIADGEDVEDQLVVELDRAEDVVAVGRGRWGSGRRR